MSRTIEELEAENIMLKQTITELHGIIANLRAKATPAQPSLFADFSARPIGAAAAAATSPPAPAPGSRPKPQYTFYGWPTTRRVNICADDIEVHATNHGEYMDIILIQDTPNTLCPIIRMQWESVLKFMKQLETPRTQMISLDTLKYQYTTLNTYAIKMPDGTFSIIEMPPSYSHIDSENGQSATSTWP